MNLSTPEPALAAQPHIPFLATGSYPPRPGNAVRPLIDGVPAFRRICAAVAAARHSVWVTPTFVAPDFQMPDGQGSFFDVLDRAAARGLDVRVLFWRPNEQSDKYGQTFGGTPSDRALLHQRATRWHASWAGAPGGFVQHQKSWLIDAGHPTETAFVGGINVTPRALGTPGHAAEGERHDAYVEITGPSATDVHHNFLQRWNEASERHRPDGIWPEDATETLTFPTTASPKRGTITVQIQRQIHAGLYTNTTPTPGGQPYNIEAGEASIRTQYKQAIAAARSTILIENQALPVPEIATTLEAALQRGVAVALLAPADPEPYVHAARRNPKHAEFFTRLEALAQYENFSLLGIAGPNPRGTRTNIYVHAKLMLIDDAWATIGSCNLHSNSLYGHSEMNATFYDPETVRALRVQLLSEHLATDTTDLDDRAALRLYRRIADANRVKGAAGDFLWQGLAFRLDPATYGV